MPRNDAAPRGPLAARHKARRSDFLSRNPFPRPLLDGFFYREKMRAIHQVAPDESVDDVLEIGGGRSGLTALLYPRARIINLDREAAYAEAAPNRQIGTRFVCGDAAHLPFPSESFGAVTMFDVVEHIAADHAAVSEALRVLRPAGALIVSTPNETWRFPYYGGMRPLCPTESEIMAEWGHVRRGYSLAELEALVGSPAMARATFITPLTVLGHDVSFSRLPARLRSLVCAGLLPITLLGYALHRTAGKGTETVALWRKG
ncbi:MAG TPA: class I SAM-dependent methyltransferase [Stellaceae bacterium]|nr:class I SAM-dependent methyltransferase [Stellaceae bacterium]